ncbi:hypothetical protein EVAR_48400_1 [Eumeta japonica]|uniref:Uncharacterized protein n=1 Tax=Eumeta variegata TaxID=151549 RepID=A0A4C1XU35_EUMVA|nr:hypothetical protein EVAR_48400_1 [Eumeta japonica]
MQMKAGGAAPAAAPRGPATPRSNLRPLYSNLAHALTHRSRAARRSRVINAREQTSLAFDARFAKLAAAPPASSLEAPSNNSRYINVNSASSCKWTSSKSIACSKNEVVGVKK